MLLDQAKRAFHRSLNAVYGRVGRFASEEVVIEIVTSKCLPILLYSTEAFVVLAITFDTIELPFMLFISLMFFRCVFVSCFYHLWWIQVSYINIIILILWHFWCFFLRFCETGSLFLLQLVELDIAAYWHPSYLSVHRHVGYGSVLTERQHITSQWCFIR